MPIYCGHLGRFISCLIIPFCHIQPGCHLCSILQFAALALYMEYNNQICLYFGELMEENLACLGDALEDINALSVVCRMLVRSVLFFVLVSQCSRYTSSYFYRTTH
ncbi:hypothetical protein LguiA_008852 [Lonicera macranthoides]